MNNSMFDVVGSVSYSTNIIYEYDVFLDGNTSASSTGNALVCISDKSYINPIFRMYKVPKGTKITGRGSNMGSYSVYVLRKSSN